MERIFHHYMLWEDYLNGMYQTQPETREAIELSRKLLATPDKCKEAMQRVVKEWRHATEFNLSNSGCQRPWLGRASCSIIHRVTENITRIAWWQLTPEEQNKANEIADTIINQWRAEHEMEKQPELFNTPRFDA